MCRWENWIDEIEGFIGVNLGKMDILKNRYLFMLYSFDNFADYQDAPEGVEDWNGQLLVYDVENKQIKHRLSLPDIPRSTPRMRVSLDGETLAFHYGARLVLYDIDFEQLAEVSP